MYPTVYIIGYHLYKTKTGKSNLLWFVDTFINSKNGYFLEQWLGAIIEEGYIRLHLILE